MNVDMTCQCPDEYSFEPHGEGWALYYGRCDHRHGYNIAFIKEPDIKQITEMLEKLKEIDQLKKVLKITPDECMAGGFVMGLAFRHGIEFGEFDKNMLGIAGKCIGRILNHYEAKP